MQIFSFKAHIHGLDNSLLASEFEKKTKSDNRHKINICKDKDTNLDIFILSKDGEPTVKYLNVNILPKNESYTIDQLIKIFKVLKIKEAQNIVLKKKHEKIETDFANSLKQMIQEDELEKKKKSETIVSIIERTDKISNVNATTLLNQIENI